MNFLKTVIICGLSLLVVTSCSKEEIKSSSLTIKMTDAPGDYDTVNVEILEVSVHYDNAGWVYLNTQAGNYDLLLLQNDVTTLLANNDTLPPGHITQMRLLLGDNNYIVKDSTDVYDLEVPGGQQTGIKIPFNYTIAPNNDYEVLIDFDADRSIVEKGNEAYSLKPVIKVEYINQL